jgi:hypothetical protein
MSSRTARLAVRAVAEHCCVEAQHVGQLTGRDRLAVTVSQFTRSLTAQ